MEKSRVEGKILVCNGPDGLRSAKKFGAIAVIFQSLTPDVASIQPLPASNLQEKDFESLVSYVESAA